MLHSHVNVQKTGLIKSAHILLILIADQHQTSLIKRVALVQMPIIR